MHRPLILVFLAACSTLWLAALSAAPTGAVPRIAAATYMAGSLICHQRPERSFHHDAAQYPVCARCLGLYVGALGGVLIWAGVAGVGASPHRGAAQFTSRPFVRRVLIVAALPTLTTLVLATLGWWDASNSARALLALPLGAAIATVLTAVIAGDLR